MADNRLMVVEDDPITRNLLVEVLERAGYIVLAAGDGPEALRMLQRHGLPRLVVVDLGLPTMHGFELCKRIKRMGDVPIVILTGDPDEENAVTGIREYAEDYIRKPFHIGEVVVRIQRILLRIQSHEPESSSLEVVDDWLSISFPDSRVIVGGQPRSLTPIENNLLHILYTNRGRVISARTLMMRVWQYEEVNEETLRVHLHRLRKKIRPLARRGDYIQTERGAGYTFVNPDSRGDTPQQDAPDDAG